MPKIALLFPGIGSEYVGMGKTFYENFLIARQTFSEASDELRFDVAKLCFEGNLSDIQNPVNSQPAMLVSNMAAFRVFMSEVGVIPVCCAGHSSGEISALTCAGYIKFSDGLKLARWCGSYISENVLPGVGAMALVSGIDVKLIEEECRNISKSGKAEPDSCCVESNGIVVVANYNSKDQVAVSGHRTAVKKLGEKLKKAGAVVVPLKGHVAFHSPLMEPMLKPFKMELNKYNYFNPKFEVISNGDALPYPGPEFVAERLVKQMAKPVLWKACIEYMEGLGVEAAVEIGPLPSLNNLMKKIVPQVKTFSLTRADNLSALNELAGKELRIGSEFLQYESRKAIEIEHKYDNLTMTDINRKLLQIAVKTFGEIDLNCNENFQTLGADSVLLVKLYSELDKEFEGLIDMSDVLTYPTINQLSECINTKLKHKSETKGIHTTEENMDDILNKLAKGEITLEEAELLI